MVTLQSREPPSIIGHQVKSRLNLGSAPRPRGLLPAVPGLGVLGVALLLQPLQSPIGACGAREALLHVSYVEWTLLKIRLVHYA